MPNNEDDACAICEIDRGFKQNPIMFCDGEDCNLPVHKDCYGVVKVPQGDWFCARCENIRMKKPAENICCSQQSGAFKHTVMPGKFMHVLCARWNRDVDHKVEPYAVNKRDIGKHTCYVCKNSGICIPCERQGCDKAFHATCGIDLGLIETGKHLPSRYELLCEEHTYTNVARERVRRRTEAREKRQRQREESAEEEEEDEEEEEAEGEDEDEEESQDEEKDKDYDEEDEDMVAPRRKPGPGKRRATAPHGRRSGPIALFMSDQSESEGEGTANKIKKQAKAEGEVKPEPMDEDLRPSDNIKTTAGLSVRGRLEAKQRKVEQARLSSNSNTNGNTKKPALALDPKPATVIPSPPAPKQKLPNKAHLHTNPVNARPPPVVNGFKRPSAPSAPILRDLDEVENGIRNPQRRSIAGPSTPTTGTSPVIPFSPENGKTSHTPQSPQEVIQQMQSLLNAFTQTHSPTPSEQLTPQPRARPADPALQAELIKLREEGRRYAEFKQTVARVFQNLGVRLPEGPSPTNARIEDYVAKLDSITTRTGAITEEERSRIANMTKNFY
ncbi:hypothetical protein BCR43DRAFT_484343 [Syncephalastrum racemosum]|uniref:PHD-type domain-containing protein n=1 Tax=Syncephalastrum racemosum TaxID=13706 RepID=A0A1X2HWM5_SYNRA|nr:hypothetical protein BCR43DRAFT_484343 [Syncephalastrum racemosum]